jgi:hypothetical protein
MIRQLLCLLLVLSASDTACILYGYGVRYRLRPTISGTTAETEPEDTRVYPELPDYDAEGATVAVVNIDYTIPIWAQRDIWAEEINGEIINDAVFQRNSIDSGTI